MIMMIISLVVIPLPVQVILSKATFIHLWGRNQIVVIPLPVQVILSSRNKPVFFQQGNVVIPLPVQVILSSELIDKARKAGVSRNPFAGSGHSFSEDHGLFKETFRESRNPFAGSGHSFTRYGTTSLKSQKKVVIPLPVQVILSGKKALQKEVTLNFVIPLPVQFFL